MNDVKDNVTDADIVEEQEKKGIVCDCHMNFVQDIHDRVLDVSRNVDQCTMEELHRINSFQTVETETSPTKISVIRLSLLEVKLLSENNRLRCARILIRADSLVPPRRRIVVRMEQFLLETPNTVKDNVTVDDNVTNELEEKKDTVSSIMANIRVATNQYYA